MTSLFKVENGKLLPAPPRPLAQESMIEDWVAADPNLLGLDAMIIGRQVLTAYGHRIDLLALDRSGDLVIIELKRDRTHRDIVGQVLDYASWIRGLATADVYDIAERYSGAKLTILYQEKFGDRITEHLNASH